MTDTPNTYDVGDVVRLTCRFYSDAELTTLADPDDVLLTIRDPYGELVDDTDPESSATGIWTFDYEPLVGGMHPIRWVGTGLVSAAEQEWIFVRRVNTA